MHGSSFDFGSLFSEFHFPYRDFENAYHKLQFFHVGSDGPTKDDFIRCLDLITTVEHEYFHYRHLISSSVGYLLFLNKQMSAVAKGAFLRSLSPLQATSLFLSPNSDLIQFAKNSSLGVDSQSHLVNFFTEEIKSEVLTKFSGKAISAFYEVREPLIYDHPLSASDETGIPILVNISPPTNSTFTTYRSSASLFEVIEGLALWKEYAYVSQLLWSNARHWFSDVIESWLNSSYGHTRYRKAVDLIANATGCNMSMALPGVLLDLALCTQAFSQRRRQWEEVHPSLRLARILSVSDRIPKSFKTVDNIDTVSCEYYEAVEAIVANALGWPKTREVLQETIETVSQRVRFGRRNESAKEIDVLGRFYDRRFLFGIQCRLSESPSLFLFPSTSPNSKVVGYLTIPPAAMFTDRISLNRVDEESLEEFLFYLNDVVLTLFLEGTINPNLLWEYSAPKFETARRIFGKRATAFPDGQIPLLGTEAISFEDFISERLNIDYKAVQRIRRKKKPKYPR
jgi:hypothetical protein